MKAIRILLSIVILAILVAVVAIGALMYFIDPNKLKPVISQEVMKKTGYQLVIDGKLTWSFYPTLGVKLQHVTVAMPGQTSPFLDLKNVSVAMSAKQLIKGIDKLDGDVYVSQVILNKIKAESAHVGLHFDKNTITLNPMTANFYQGTINGTANGRDVTTAPVWQWDVQLNQVQVQPLLQDINNTDSKLTIAGTAAIKFKASTWGVGKASLINNLNGGLDISVVKGVLTGIDLNYLLKTADALLNKGDVEKPADINQTAFDSFTSTVDIKNGLAETNNLLIAAPNFTTKGNGSVNLPYQAINFQLQVTPAKDARTQWVVPVLIAGNFNHPDIRLDMTEVNKFLVKQGVDKAKDKLRDEIKKKVPGQAGELLQNLLGH